jgi:putative endonuclease
MNHRQTVGKLGEKIASDFLTKRGYLIKDKNYHSRFGEIDIVASREESWYFVEVKTRCNDSCGLGEEAVTDNKKVKIFKTIQEYIANNEIEDEFYFQVIVIELDFQTRRAKLRYYPQVALF